MIIAGPGVGGGRIEFRPAGSMIVPGMSVAPLAVQAFAWADAELGTGIGPLAAAPDVRVSSAPPNAPEKRRLGFVSSHLSDRFFDPLPDEEL